MKDFFRAIFSILKWIGSFLSAIRSLFFNVLFFGILAIVLISLFHSTEPVIPLNSILKLTISGNIVEQPSVTNPVEGYLPDFLGLPDKPPETSFQEILDTLAAARDDDNIKAVLLDLSTMGYAGMNQLRDIGAALVRFRESGKKVIAAEDYYSQQQYYLATYADSIFLNPMGGVNLTGLGLYRFYYQEALEKLKIKFHVFQVGEYKSATEPLTRSSMSPQDREQSRAWLNDLWASYVADVAEQRSISTEAVNGYINRVPDNLREVDGNLALLAQKSGLVDELKQRHEIDRYLVELTGSGNQDEPHFISSFAYAQSIEPSYQDTVDDRDTVALIIAEGSIMSGESGPGVVGAETMIELLREARTTPSVKAVVLRVDSGGGSAFASELIRQEVLQLQESGKPVIVSMGTVAASGAYWLSANADEIWASPSTLTGSIGIFMAIPTFESLLTATGINRDGVGTTNLSAGIDLSQPLAPELKQAIQLTIEHGYHTFTHIVADGRNMDDAAVEQIAQGRVYSGQRALEIGLVDKLGSLDDALKAAAVAAGLDDYAVSTLAEPLSMKERFLQRISSETYTWLSRHHRSLARLVDLADGFEGRIAPLLLFDDPNGLYAHCLLPGTFFGN